MKLLLYFCCALYSLHANSQDKAPRPSADSSPTQSVTLAAAPVLTSAQPRALTLEQLIVTGNLHVQGTITNQGVDITNVVSVGTSANTPYSPVVRDSAGGFAAGTITATNVVISALNATTQTGNLYIDGQGNLVIGIGGLSGATADNVPGVLIARDNSGSFAAQHIYVQSSLEPVAPSTTLDLGAYNAQTVNIGNASQTDTINLGTGANLQIVNMGTGAGQTTINIGAAQDTVNVAGTLTQVTTNDLAIANKLLTLNASGGVASGFNSGIQVAEAGDIAGYVKTSGDRSSWLMQAPAATSSAISLNPANSATLGVLHSDAYGNISTSYIVNADVAPNAMIADNKLATISSAGQVDNSSTTATASNSPSALLLRDFFGALAGGTITANQFVGTLGGNATAFTGILSGDVTGTQANTTIVTVGGQGVSTVAATTTAALSATSTDVPSVLILRDPIGAFAAGTVSANQFVGTLSGNVIGAIDGVPAATVASIANSITATNTPNTLVLTDQTDSFSAGTISANQFIGTLNGNVIGSIGGALAAHVASASSAIVAEISPLNIPNTFVLTDQTDSFAAGTITGNQFVGTVNGNVTGYAGGFTAALVASASNFLLDASTGNSNTLVLRDGSGSFTANKENIIGLPTPAFVGTGSYTIGAVATTDLFVATQGQYLYLVRKNSSSTPTVSLFIINIANPSNPLLVSTTSLPGSSSAAVGGFVVQGKYAYYTDNSAGVLVIVDVGNVANPTITTSFTLVNKPSTGLAVASSYLYFPGTSDDSLDVYNVSNPQNPVFIGAFRTPNGSTGSACTVQGRYLYMVTKAPNSLIVYDLISPASPSPVGTVTGFANIPAAVVPVRNAYAFYICSTGVYMVNISNPTNPIIIGTYSASVTGTLYGATLQGNYLYLAQSAAPNLLVLNVSNPSQIAVAARSYTPNTPLAIYAEGRYLYSFSAGASSNFAVYDISGAYIQQLEAGGIDTTTVNVNGLTRLNQLDILGTTTYGEGFFATEQSALYGQLQIAGSSTLSAAAPLVVNASSASVPALSIIGSPSAPATIIQSYQGQPSVQLLNTATLSPSTNSPNLYIDQTGHIWQGSADTPVNLPNALVARDSSGSFALQTLQATNMVLKDLPATASASNVYIDQNGIVYQLYGNSTNVLGALVLRDQTGSFAAGTITGSQFVGTLSNTSNVIGYIGGVTASTVSAAANLIAAATSNDVISTLVFLDPTTSFAAGTVNAILAGTLSNTSNVSGLIGGVAASKVATMPNIVAAATSNNVPNTLVLQDQFGSFAAGSITGNLFVGTLDSTSNAIGRIGGTSITTVLSAANVNATGTSNNVSSTLIMRDAFGSFAAGTVRANKFVGTLDSTSNAIGYIGGVPAVNAATAAYVVATGTSNNVTSSLVLRDVSGSFAAGTITARQFVGTLGNTSNVIGRVGGVLAASVASAANVLLNNTSGNVPQNLVYTDPTDSFSAGTVSGAHLIGTLGNTSNVIGYVGGLAAANVAAATMVNTTGTSNNVPNTPILRDASGDFSAGTISANQFAGTLSNTSNVSGSVGSIPVTNLITGLNNLSINTSNNTPSYLVLRDPTGSFTAGTVTANPFFGTLNSASNNTTGYVGGFTAALVPSASNILIQASTGSPATLILRDGSGSFTANKENIIGLATPQIVYQYNFGTGTYANGAIGAPVIQNEYLYLLVNNNQTFKGILVIFNIANPTNPILISQTAFNGNGGGLSAASLVVQGRYAYISNGNNNLLTIFDISNPTSPLLVAQYTFNCSSALAIQGTYLYTCNTFGGGANLYTYNNISQPSAVTLSAITALPNVSSGTALSCCIQGKYLFIPARQTNNTGYLVILDISNPASPQVISELSIASALENYAISVRGKYAYLLGIYQGGGALAVFVINISNPGAPALVGSCTVASSAYIPYFISLQGNYLFCGSGSAQNLAVVNISNPTAPTLVTSFSTVISPRPLGVLAAGRYLYSLDQTSTTSTVLTILDIGGLYAQQLEAGGLETTTLFTDGLARVNQLDVLGASAFGQGILATGQSAFQFSGTINPSGTMPVVSVVGNSLFQPASSGTLPTLTLVGSSSTGSAPVVAALRLVSPGSVTSPTSIGLDSSGDVVIAASSKRFKENIQPVTPAEIASVYTLEPVTYDPKPGAYGPAHQFGLIAEEVAEIFPQLVARDSNGSILSIYEHQFPALLIAAVQELKKKQLDLRAQQLQIMHSDTVRHSETH